MGVKKVKCVCVGGGGGGGGSDLHEAAEQRKEEGGHPSLSNNVTINSAPHSASVNAIAGASSK